MSAIEAVSSIDQVLKFARTQKDLPVDDALAQKFASLMLENSYGTQMERGLTNLKELLEK